MIENIVSKQEDFFLQNSATLKPMTMREVALDLDLHESTIARAVAHKYVNTPKGIFAIKYFFSGKYLKGVDDEISQNSVKDIIKQIVAQENKNQPLSDEAISKKLRAINICCSRRTVSKHRQGLNIASSRQRKRY